MLQVDQVLQNRYRIIHVLGQGGMGAVYQAYDQRLNRAFVVKEMLITPEAANNMAEAARQFQKEAEVLAGLRHPGLPVVTDYFLEGGSYFLVMDFIAGQSLQELIPPGGLPEATVLNYADQLLDTLQYIHTNGVVHRDIKPANIIIKPDGRVVLVDFGLVKVMQSGGGLTTTGFARGMGTPEYAPPEQSIGRTDQRSDIYSLGATLYRMLTGQAPASATERVAVKPLIEPRQLQPGISVRTEQVILRAMALMQNERYPDASAMRVALAGKKPPRPQNAPAPSPVPERTQRMPAPGPAQRRISPLVAVAGLALVAVVASVAVVLRMVLSSHDSPAPTVEPVVAAVNVTATANPAPTHAPSPSPTQVKANDLLLTLAPGVTMEFVRVPAGEFLMGSANDDKDASFVERPQQKVNLGEYLISTTDVTNRQFRAFVQATGYKTTAEAVGSGSVVGIVDSKDIKGADWQHPTGPASNIDGLDNYPVVQVSWDDAVAFCKWVSQVTGGRKIQLPSEAQWEKAARGTDGRLYPWGNHEPDLSWLNYNNYARGPSVVRGYSPQGDSPYGAADMAGNVRQWTNSMHSPYPYNANDGREDQNNRFFRVLRGGGFGNDRVAVRSANRERELPMTSSADIGFRIVASPQ